ncbi:MAG: SLBB domain-containing protein, partial [Armatimonadetes bacterium]|nr:SLBB domain-containing protein [Armatimonadota bacterium]
LQDGDTVVVGSLQLPEVAVLGQVAREGHYTLRSGAKLSQAIAQAGGFTSMADTDHVKLVRNGEQQFVDLSMIERGAELPADPQLQDGDLIIVPESMHRVTILGLVKNPGNYMFKKGDRVVDVLGEAGGWIERQGAPNRAILVRKLPDGRLGAGEISPLRTAVRGDQKGNPLLEDGDIIYIPQVSRMTFTGILNTLFQGSSFVRLILE